MTIVFQHFARLEGTMTNRRTPRRPRQYPINWLTVAALLSALAALITAVRGG
ncbi:hypothetical protein Daura_32525 [Dactylosporangium aurantiacum]|uniref:Uncharacterized protein n=1 Tax=Dactylosporangium aurantiacum TaxID=35754 RepID=A0A9Q9MEI1_9ACTN|nr:hypothetical protein [Dactylosporangium aurantiacum]UWZ51460.1 hypothetical protein Daura_32525 [Dactylosporangium aurantiacum]